MGVDLVVNVVNYMYYSMNIQYTTLNKHIVISQTFCEHYITYTDLLICGYHMEHIIIIIS